MGIDARASTISPRLAKWVIEVSIKMHCSMSTVHLFRSPHPFSHVFRPPPPSPNSDHPVTEYVPEPQQPDPESRGPSKSVVVDAFAFYFLSLLATYHVHFNPPLLCVCVCVCVATLCPMHVPFLPLLFPHHHHNPAVPKEAEQAHYEEFFEDVFVECEAKVHMYMYVHAHIMAAVV